MKYQVFCQQRKYTNWNDTNGGYAPFEELTDAKSPLDAIKNMTVFSLEYAGKEDGHDVYQALAQPTVTYYAKRAK